MTILAVGTFSLDVEAKEAYYVNQNGVEMSELQYNKFLKFYSERKIEHLTLEEFNKYKDANIIALDTVYQKTTYSNGKVIESKIITETEYNSVSESQSSNAISPQSSDSSYVETSYKKLSATLFDIGSQYDLMGTLSWKKMPYVRSYDVFAFRFNLFNYSNFTGVQEYYKGNSYYRIDYNTSSAGYKSASNGVGVSMNLKDDTDITGLELTITATLTEQATSATKAHAYITYQHAQNDLTRAQSMGYTFDISGLGNVLLYSNQTVRDTYDRMSGLHLISNI